MKEIWKNVVGWEGYYQVSNYGRIKRTGKIRGARVGRILVANKSSNGYLTVRLSQNGNCKTFSIHALVLEAFAGQCPLGMECRHLDGNPHHNRLDNLRWGTKSENKQDCIEHGTHIRGSRNGRSKLTEDDILPIVKLLHDGKTQKEIAIIFNVSKSRISKIKLNKTWRHISR